jgi:hypothetical protein
MDNYAENVGFVFGLSLAITLVALLLQSEYGKERSERGSRLGGLVQAASLVYVKPENWPLLFGALVFSFVVAVVAGIVFGFGFGRPESSDPAVKLAVQIAQAQLFVLVPAYLVSLLRIYASATRGALGARTFFEATTDVALACLAAVALWLFWAIWGGLAPLATSDQPVGLLLSFAIGCCPSLSLIRRWTARRFATHSLLTVYGMDQSHSVKLYEAGVRNMQNLAYADPGALFTITGLQLLWIVDWIAQAQLRVLISDESGKVHKLDELRQLGINNILDLARALDEPQVQERIREAFELTAGHVRDAGLSTRPISIPGPNSTSFPFPAPAAAPNSLIRSSGPASLTRDLIENNPSFRVLQNYAAVVEKPPASVDEVARKIDQAVHGAPIANYTGDFVLSLTDLNPAEGVGCRGTIMFSTKADSERRHAAPIRINDGEQKSDPNARIQFDVRVNFRPPVAPGQSFRIDAPLDGESSSEQFEVTNPTGKSVGVLIKILQANRLIQTLSAKFPSEE